MKILWAFISYRRSCYKQLSLLNLLSKQCSVGMYFLFNLINLSMTEVLKKNYIKTPSSYVVRETLHHQHIEGPLKLSLISRGSKFLLNGILLLLTCCNKEIVKGHQTDQLSHFLLSTFSLMKLQKYTANLRHIS